MKYDEKLQERVINRLIELHQVNYNRVDFAKQDRRQAIYFLQGAAITSAVNARRLKNETGILGREWRYISEVSYTVQYFDELSDDSRELRAWFTKDGIIERKPKKGVIDTAERQQKSGLDPSLIQLYDTKHKEITDSLSLFAHPSYKSTIGNTTRRTKKFDYYHSYDEEDPEALLSLKGIFVSEAVTCILLPIDTFMLPEEHYMELFEYKKLLNDRSRRFGEPGL